MINLQYKKKKSNENEREETCINLTHSTRDFYFIFLDMSLGLRNILN